MSSRMALEGVSATGTRAPFPCGDVRFRKRLVEVGRDVVLFVDSITRLSRAHNTARNSGRTGTGGLDVRALEKPRQIFSAARKTEEAGSLTIIASVLVVLAVAPHDGHLDVAGPDRTGTAPIAAAGVFNAASRSGSTTQGLRQLALVSRT